ncbi:hypothetical protein [Petrimonas sulfuriphila]|uniref:hypothetical protein n=1 Tax=Petrimonas sulfuriphila TaxID=285070 RepID=UPI003EBAD25A
MIRPATILRKLLNKLFHIRSETYYLFEISITSDSLNVNLLPDPYRVAEITKENIRQYDFSLFANKYPRFVERIQNPVNKCYVVLDKEKVCYYTWISLTDFIFPRYVKEVRKLDKDVAFLFDSQCAKEYRGNGFHSYMNIFRLQKIGEDNKTKALGLILAGNKPAFKVQLKSGMKITHTLRTFCCNWLNINRIKFVEYEN